MDDKLIVTIGGLKMFGRPGLGPVCVVKDGLVGWDGRTLRGEDVQRPVGPGSYPLPKDVTARSVSVTGLVNAGGAPEHERVKQWLAGLGADGELLPIQVERAGGVQWAQAQVDDVKMDDLRGAYRSSFIAQISCPDPRKFGDMKPFTSAQGATLKVTQRGNFKAHPYVIIRGDLPNGYTLYGPNGEAFEVTASVVTGSKPHTVDFNQGILKISGQISPLSTQQAAIWTVPGAGGESSFRLVPNAGSNGTIEVQVTDTYI